MTAGQRLPWDKSNDAQRRWLGEFLTALKRVCSTCSLTITDLERLLDHCLLCRAPANHLGIFFPVASLWGVLDAQRVVAGFAPCAAGKSPVIVYTLCERCVALPECLSLVEDCIFGRPLMRDVLTNVVERIPPEGDEGNLP